MVISHHSESARVTASLRRKHCVREAFANKREAFASSRDRRTNARHNRRSAAAFQQRSRRETSLKVDDFGELLDAVEQHIAVLEHLRVLRVLGIRAGQALQ